jgi:NitT/TauT family transport system substrate-binding protein
MRSIGSIPSTGSRRLRVGSALIVATATTLALAACSSSASSSSGSTTTGSGSGSASGSGALTKITIVPSHLNSGSNGAVLAAVQDGLFKQCGFDVSVKEGGGGGDTVRTVTSGAAQFAFPSVASVLPAFKQGNKIAVVAGQTLGTNGGAMLVLPNSTLSGPASLKGKKVGISAAGSNNATQLDTILRQQGINPSAVSEVVVGAVPAGMAALAAGAVSATWATEPDVTQLVAQGKAKVLFKVDDYIKNYQLTVTIASAGYAQKNPDVVKRFVDCMDQANAYAATNPTAAGAAFATVSKQTPAVATAALKVNLTPSNLFSVNVSVPGMQEGLNELVDAKVLPAGTTLTQFKSLFALPSGGKATLTGGSI